MSPEYLDLMDESLNPLRIPCARCGQPAYGFATIGPNRYCHPNNPDRPDCYTLACHENPTRTGPDIVGVLRYADPDATDLDLEGTTS